MILVPLFTPPSDSQGWHQVTAPGGYEWWGVDAQDHTGRLRITARFYLGYPFHPAYARRYARYRWRPTKHLPPTADQFPCVHLAVYENEKLAGQFLSQYPPTAFAAATDRLDVRIGPNNLRQGSDGSLRLTISNGTAPSERSGNALSIRPGLMAELKFHANAATPVGDTGEGTSPASAATNRSPISGLAGVSGTIDLGSSQDGGAAGRRLTFTGTGFCQHQFGTAPPAFELSRLATGHLFVHGRAYVFQIRRMKRHWLDEVQLWEVTPGGSTELRMTGIRSDWTRHTSQGVAHPAIIECLPHLRLSSPRVIASSLGSAQLVYQAQVEGSPARAEAWCEVVIPARSACPLMGRWIERSIHHVAAQA